MSRETYPFFFFVMIATSITLFFFRRKLLHSSTNPAQKEVRLGTPLKMIYLYLKRLINVVY